jgi:AraC-like DNA-binding protein
MVYRPHIIIVGQGRKRAYLGGKTYQYDPANYLVLAVPLPAECDAETEDGKPILLVNIDVDTTMVGEMMLEMDDFPAPARQTPRGISSTPMTPELGGAVIRLLECLKCPVDSRLLGRQMVREVVYRVLRGEQGGALSALASRDDHFTRIARVLKYVHSEYSKPLDVEELARRAGMSASVFHHHFKLVTACSPLQYIKRIRLDRARALMTLDGYNAGSAARAVGYESASQFGREFKRLFGLTPLEEAEQTRARLVAG